MKATTFICLFGSLVFGVGLLAGSPEEKVTDTLEETPVDVNLIYKVGSSNQNEDFYGPSWFCVDSDENVYILDTKNSRVQCFTSEGKYYLSFGRFGQGPGELSSYARKIKILADENIYVLDAYSKINIYDKKGIFKKQIRVQGNYYDIEMINQRYYLCGCTMNKNRAPIHECDLSGKLLRSFGIIYAPQEGLLEEITREPKSEMIEDFFNIQSGMIRTTKNELIYSLKTSDRLIKYDVDGKVVSDYIGDFEFSDKLYTIIQKQGIPFIWPNWPMSVLYTPIARSDGRIVVPFVKQEGDYLYFDVYESDFSNQRRYKIMEIIEKPLVHVHIDEMNNLYCLVAPKDCDPYLVKYRLSIKL